MSENFYKDKIEEFGIKIILSDKKSMDIINKIIYEELCFGVINKESKRKYLDIISKLSDVNGIILGCIEICLLISQNDLKLPIFDATLIHVKMLTKLSVNYDIDFWI